MPIRWNLIDNMLSAGLYIKKAIKAVLTTVIAMVARGQQEGVQYIRGAVVR
jgi:hypothetical protein